MPRLQLSLLCALSLCSFAANSLLARAAVGAGSAGPWAYLALRFICGAAVVWPLARSRGNASGDAGWLSALSLVAYGVPFSWAYLRLQAGVGAFLLFGSVQATMIGVAMLRGDRPGLRTGAGLVLALVGLGVLALPGAHAPDPAAAAAMIVSGVAWGWYSLRGMRARDGLAATASALTRAVPFVALLWLVAALVPGSRPGAQVSIKGALLAAASGALASGLGYTIWNTALPRLRASTASILQLAVPALTALGGILFLGESLTLRLAGSGAIIFTGIALAIRGR